MISILTAVAPDRQRYLDTAWESLLSQSLVGSEWEWCLQYDGVRGDNDFVPEDGRVSVCYNGGSAGAGATRNLALSRARGRIIVTLDADDVLLPGALQVFHDAFASDETVGWVATGHILLEASGVQRSDYEPLVLGNRRVAAGTLVEWWDRLGHIPVIPHCVAYTAPLARAMGGWMALPRSEDAGLVFAVAEAADGMVIDVATLGYRQWPMQQIKEEWKDDSSYAKAAGRTLIRQRIGELNLLLGR